MESGSLVDRVRGESQDQDVRGEDTSGEDVDALKDPGDDFIDALEGHDEHCTSTTTCSDDYDNGERAASSNGPHIGETPENDRHFDVTNDTHLYEKIVNHGEQGYGGTKRTWLQRIIEVGLRCIWRYQDAFKG